MVNRTPSQELAARAVDCLLTAGLIRAEQRERIISRIATGTMKGGDWKLEIELAGDGNRT